MNPFGKRPAGRALWEDREPLRQVEGLAEVKIIGMKTMPGGDKKILVWKNYAAGAKPTWITAKNLQKHAPDLIDPPEGTTDEYPPIGDISDPASFTGAAGDIQPMPGKDKVPEMGKDQAWIPSHKLKALAAELKSKGFQPQNTFSKAIAAGEPLPDAFPEPVGMDALPKGEPPAASPEPPPEALVPQAPPEAPAAPGEPPAEPKVADADVDIAIQGGQHAELVAGAKLLTKAQVGMIADAYGATKDTSGPEAAIPWAETMAAVLDARGDNTAAESWQKTAEALKAFVAGPDAPEGLTDDEVSKAIAAGDDDLLAANGATMGLPQKIEIKKGIDGAADAGDWGKAAKLCAALAEISGIQGMGKAAALYTAKQAEFLDKAASGEGPPTAPEEVPDPPAAPANPVPGYDPEWIFDWDPEAPDPPPSKEKAKAKQEGLGLNPMEFVHPLTQEVFAVTNLSPGEYVDPDTGAVFTKDGKKSTGKQISSTGMVFELPDPTGEGTAGGKVYQDHLSTPPEKMVEEPPPEIAVTPSKVDKLPTPPPAPPAYTPAKPTDMMKAAAKIVPPADIPKPEDLSLVGSGNHLGGAGDKEIYKDATGQKWLFKLAYDKYGGKPKPYAAAAQQCFAEVARRVRPDHIPVGVATIKGKIGTLQPMLDLDPKQQDLKVHGKNVPMTQLSPEDHRSLAGEHILDWMMSQHDSHGGQFIRAADGTLFGVDKEQGFRFFGQDKLSVDYHPNPDAPPIYNDLWKAWVRGDIEMDPQDLSKEIEKVEDISEKDYVAMLRPYAETLYPKSPEKQREFLKAARKRKLDIRKDFERFFTDLYRAKHKTDKGEFTFAKGWVDSAAGPKKVIKKYKAKDMVVEDTGSSQGGWTITLPGYSGLKLKPYHNPDNPSEKDETKLTLKAPVNDQNAIQKMKQMLDKLGIKPISEAHLAGSQYAMLFINKADWDAAAIEQEEIVEPKGIGKTPPKPHYYPDYNEYHAAPDNASELANIQNMTLGRAGRRFSSDGTGVEGGVMRVKKFKKSNGQEYHLASFKLRPQIWKKLANVGDGGKFSFPLAAYNDSSDAFEEVGGASDSVDTRKVTVGKSELHIATGEYKYAYMGSCYMKVVPKKGQTPLDAMKELLEAAQPGLAAEVFRDPTPEEVEVEKLSRLLWAVAPQAADKLKESERTVENLRAVLKQHKADKRADSLERREVFPGYSADIEPGRWKKLAGGKFQYFFNGINSVTSVVSIMKSGLLGIHERNQSGIAKFGGSYDADVHSGSGDGILLRPVTAKGAGNSFSGHSFSGVAQAIVSPTEADRLDSYMYLSDTFGRCREDSSDWKSRKSVEDAMASQQKGYKSGAEISFRRGVQAEQILRIVCGSESTRSSIIKEALSQGISEVNGVPIEDFVAVENNLGSAYEKYVKPMFEE